MEKKNLLLVLLVALTLSLAACSDSDNEATRDSNVTSQETKEATTDNLKNNRNDESWSKTAGNTNGKDWLTMTEGQKEDIVTGVIQSWVDNDYMVKEDYSWFISNVNDFYGSEATDTFNLSEAMSQIAVAGDVLEDKSAKEKEDSYSSKSSSSSSEGEFWCMGKNDTCQNKTNSPNIFFCEECDRNRDNIEDSKQ